METVYWNISLLIFGMLLQLLFIFGRKINEREVAILILMLIFSILIRVHAPQYLIVLPFLIGVFVSVFFQKEALPSIDIFTLMVWCLGSSYLSFIYFGSSIYFFILLTLNCIIVIFNLLNFILTFPIRLLSYIWFIFINIAIVILSPFFRESIGSYQHISLMFPFLEKIVTSTQISLEFLFYGMISLPLFTYFNSIIYFIPIPDHRSMKVRMEDIKAHALLLSTKFEEIQYSLLYLLSLLGMLTLSILANHFFDIIDPNIFVFGLLAVVPLLKPYIFSKIKKNVTTFFE